MSKTHILIGRRVKHRHRESLFGHIIEVIDGCNPLARVAFDSGTTALLPYQDLAMPDGTLVNDFVSVEQGCQHDDQP